MEKVTVTLTNPIGLHARPASLLTKLVNSFECDVHLFKNGDTSRKHQPKSILSIMSLCAVLGDELTFEATGRDEKEAIQAIEAFVKSGCGE